MAIQSYKRALENKEESFLDEDESNKLEVNILTNLA